MKVSLFIFVFLILFLSCDKFEYSHYQIYPDDKDINNKNIKRFIEKNCDTIKVVVIGDSQRFYHSTQKIINKINEFLDFDFVLHTGDLVDFGLQREYTWMHEQLSKIKFPYVAVVGNHDLIGNGNEIYKKMYGDYNFSFVYNDNKFIFLNTNGREFNFSKEVPDIPWLDQELSDTNRYKRAIIVNHVAPNNVDFNQDLEQDYVNTLNKYKKTILSINGHRHNFSFSEIYEDSIPYLNSFSTSKEKFILLKIWDNDFSIEKISCEPNTKE